MTLIIGFLTAILFLDAVLLVLLILIQLPKKEAGMGVAFGAGATDALFGAGSGSALTHITKYSATVFLGLALILTVLGNWKSKSEKNTIEDALQQEVATQVETTPLSSLPIEANILDPSAAPTTEGEVEAGAPEASAPEVETPTLDIDGPLSEAAKAAPVTPTAEDPAPAPENEPQP